MMELHYQTAKKTAAFILATGLAMSSAAVAQQQEIEEVVVTATKRGAANMQSTPISIQALTGDRLTDMGAIDFNDFFRQVPGLAVFDQGPGDKRYIIRGVNATGAGTVGLYLGEVIITGENAQDGGGRQPDIKLYDLERVEVLKGPQGTTFGSSSLSGTIRYLPRLPDLVESDAMISLTGGKTRGADADGQVTFAANLPLIDNQLAVRVAGLYLEDKGHIDNRFEEGANSERTKSGRVSVRYAPTDRLTLDFMAMNQDMETDGPYYFNRVDLNGDPLPSDHQADLTRNPFFDDTTIYNGTLEYVSDYGTITATASRLDRETVFNRDASAAVPPTTVITQPKDRTVDSFEVRFASNWNSPFQILAGAFTQREERSFQSRIFPADPTTGKFTEQIGFSLDRNVDTKVDEDAIFGELSYDFSDSITLTAGLRWFDMSVTEQATAFFGFAGNPAGGAGPVLNFGEDDIIGKLNLSYNVNNDVMLFAQWAQGFRAGGTNDQTAAEIADVVIPQGFGSDSVDSYELGLKSQWLNNRLRLNSALYYIDWADIQIQDQAQDPDNPSVFFPFRSNGGAADIYGLEVDLTYRPLAGLELTLAGNYTDAELSENNPIPSTGRKGDDITYVPDTTLSVSGQYTRPIPNTSLNGVFGMDVTHVSERNTELRPNNPLFIELDSYTLVNFRAGVETNDWSAMLIVDNVFDDDTVLDVFRIIPGLTPDGFLVQEPRTISLKFTKHFM